VQVAATYDAFVEALQNPGFDVLHVACHGDVKEDNIEKAELVITDELVNGRPKFVSISANVVGKIARFGTRRPLVFLNACEAGRLGESLTAWGGWPSRLINAGAGAVVGASWPVRDVASNAFATTFYDSLLDGKSLSAAASRARTSAAAIGDATWLSFKVFGDPHARG
jgi:CHAT domain-containing protein